MIWPADPGGKPYEEFVQVESKTEGGQAEISLVLPYLESDKLRFRVRRVMGRDGEGQMFFPVHAYGSSIVTVYAPEAALQDMTLQVSYIDARAIGETTKNPDKMIDWSIRSVEFKLGDVLKDEV